MVKTILVFLMPFYLLGINIDVNTTKLHILPHASIFIDKSNLLTKEEIISKPFKKYTKKSLAVGYAPHKSLWISFKLKNTSSIVIQKVLSYENTLAQTVIFHDDTRVKKSGLWHRNEDKKYLTPSFNIQLEANEEKTYYIKAHSEFTALSAKVVLWNQETLLEKNRHISYLIIIFLSIMFTLLFYNFVIFLFTRDKTYLFYSLYLLAMVLAHSTRGGVLQYYLLNDEITQIYTQYISLVHALFIITILLFTREFLNTYQHPKLDFLLKSYLYITPIMSLLTCQHILFDIRMMYVFMPLGPLLIFAGFYSLSQGKKEAVFYLFGWSLLMFAVIATPLRSLGIFNIHQYIPFIYTIAFIVEAFLFSFALAYRIKLLDTEKKNIQHKFMLSQQEEQQKLEALVKEKTKNITSLLSHKELLFQELNHRVKNNLQLILSLIKLQISNTSSSQTKDELMVTKNRIDSFTQLYENLHLQEHSYTFNTKEHFETIINNNFHASEKNIRVHYDITYNLKETHLLYAGLIVNELSTNALKYAFLESGNIEVGLHKIDGLITLTFFDDGIGVKPSMKESLGLNIVKTLSTKQLHGKIGIQSNQGIQITIRWKDDD